MKIFKSLGAALLAMAIGVGMAMMIQPANATNISGETVNAQAWCLELSDVKTLAAAMSEDGKDGYIAVMDAKGNSCLDTVRMGRWGPNGTTIQLRLVERILSLDYEGKAVEIWSASDKNGKVGYIWLAAGPSA